MIVYNFWGSAMYVDVNDDHWVRRHTSLARVTVGAFFALTSHFNIGVDDKIYRTVWIVLTRTNICERDREPIYYMIYYSFHFGAIPNLFDIQR